MSAGYHIGQRVSYNSALCTVRYQGLVAGTKGEWLGVEWDDPSRGKHNGARDGARYFDCRSKHPTAGSFIRPTRPANPPLTFLEALHWKYAYETSSEQNAEEKAIVWGGKTVEEVGFEKIRRQLAMLHELKIVLLDGLCVSEQQVIVSGKDSKEISTACPKIQELDLSRNLFERWEEVVCICKQLGQLRSLKVNGNRLRDYRKPTSCAAEAFTCVTQLGLENTLSSWEEMTYVASSFVSLTSLSVSSNELSCLSQHLPPQSITKLTLESNDFTSLSSLAPLTKLDNLQSLHLRDNPISTINDATSSASPLAFSSALTYVDFSYNAIASWPFINQLQDVFPGLTALRVSRNPLYDSSADGQSPMGIDEGYMLTLARLGRLETLNFSNITPPERRDAEMYYLSRVARTAAELPEEEESAWLSQHPRWNELCEIYGPPVIKRTATTTINPNSLEARLIDFTFYQPSSDGTSPPTLTKQVPRGFDTYRLKGIVGRLFGVTPLHAKLVWETGEWDPVAGYHEQAEDDESDDEDTKSDAIPRRIDKDIDQRRWTKREIELRDGTREVGFWIEGREARVRVEMR